MKTTMTCLLLLAVCTHSAYADPWADRVIEYVPGEGIGTDFVSTEAFTNELVSLGQPTRYTSDSDNYGGAVTPLNGAFRSNEVVSVGRGGSLTVAFDEPVTDDPRNPFGIDLLVFGNAFFFDADFPNGVAGTYANEGGIVEVSEDGINFSVVPNVEAEGLFPTLGYLDLDSAFATSPGLLPSDFTKPVDPSFDPAGLPFDQIVAGYNGSGGGAGVDLASVGLSQISFVRITVAADAMFVPEIDAFADVRGVPEPTSLLLAVLGMGSLWRRRFAR